MTQSEPALVTSEPTSIKSDTQFHHYSGNRIPWYVRLMWIGFWIFAITYTLQYLFPAIQVELFQK
jgi:hypothetical protein